MNEKKNSVEALQIFSLPKNIIYIKKLEIYLC